MIRYLAAGILMLLLLVVLLFLCYSISYYITAGHYNAKIVAIRELHRIEKDSERGEKKC